MNRIIPHNHTERSCWFRFWQIKYITCKVESGLLASLDSLLYTLNGKRHKAETGLTMFALPLVFLTIQWEVTPTSFQFVFSRSFFFHLLDAVLISKLGFVSYFKERALGNKGLGTGPYNWNCTTKKLWNEKH